MNDKRISPSNQSIFVIPVGDEVELYVEYNGLQWSNDSINEEKLLSFSENCQGIHINFLKTENGRLLLFSQKENIEDSIKIYFERIFSKQLPCAFFDKISKTYDNFEIPDQTTLLRIYFMPEGGIEVEWQYEENEVIDDSSDDDPVSLISQEDSKKDELKEFKKEDSLSKKNIESRVDSGSNAVNDEEIERLKTLVTQLVDRRFDDPYIQTQDAKINEMTATIVSQRKKLAEKEASLRSLEQEESEVEQAIVEIKKNITNAMDNIHKAERIKQEQSAELSDIQSSLQQILSEIDMDIDTLEMYSEQDSLSSVVSEAQDAKNKIEEKLKSFIQERQKECEERSKRIQTS